MLRFFITSWVFFIAISCFGQAWVKWKNEAIHYQKSNEFGKSAEYFQKALNSCAKCSETEKIDLLINQGNALKLAERYSESHEKLKSALTRAKNLKSNELIARAYISLVEYYRSRTMMEDAFLMLRETESYVVNGKVTTETEIEYYNRYAAVLNEASNDQQMVLYYSYRALTLSKKMSDSNSMAVSYNEIGHVLEHQNRLSEANENYRRALTIWTKTEQFRNAANVCVNLSRSHSKYQDTDSTLYYANLGLSLVDTNKWSSILVDLYAAKLRALNALGNWEEMTKTYELFHIAVLDLRGKEWNLEMARISGELGLDKQRELLKSEKEVSESARQALRARKDKEFVLVVLLLFVGISTLVTLYFVFRVRRSNRQLTDALHERDLLLKEVHHRVKNNMQVISSLLELQANFTSDPKALEALNDSKDRVNSLALAHQHIYTNNHYDTINIKTYLSMIAKTVVDPAIKVQLESVDEHLPIDKAQALGFIFNELLTNSMKHAWNNNDEKLIWVKLLRLNEEFNFYYSDNGIGLRDQESFLGSPTFGVTLIRSFLKRNLKGEIVFGDKPGMNISFTFK